ncbi:GNAT family N-acetyltransferase [Paenibacillus sp. CAU 1782]
MEMKDILIKEVPSDSADLAELIAALDLYLLGLYRPEEIYTVDFADPKTKDMIFVVAYDGDRAIGCGGIRLLDAESVELKRFFVVPDMRRGGVAGSIYRYLEERAAGLGCRIMRLETGEPQHEAVTFYQKYGYYKIEPFGEYEGCESSLCMEKVLP